MATNDWCLQCGVDGRAQKANGLDEDGEPACGLHRVPSVEPVSVKPAPEASDTMNDTKPCPGVLGAECGTDIGPRKEVCNRCYARRNYAQKHQQTTAKKTARKPRGRGAEQALEPMATPMEILKNRLQEQLAAILLVESMLED